MVWAVVLGPSLLRNRSERRSADSIGDFHRQLRVLQRTGPSTVDPAYRLNSPHSSNPFRFAGAEVQRRRGVRRPDPYFRQEACRRRRNVLVGLVVAVAATGLLGVVPALRPTLFVTIIGAMLLVSYIGLLVYSRRLAVEREAKLHYLPERFEPDAAAAVRRVAAR